MHTLLDLRGPIPSFIHVSDGKMDDALALDLIAPEAGSISWLRRFSKTARVPCRPCVLRDTRQKQYEVSSRLLASDRQIRWHHGRPIHRSRRFYTGQDYPEHLRRIRFCDPDTNKRLAFVTNNFALPAKTIAALYKKRWQVELFMNGSITRS
jgi:hypothetical protein